MLAGHSLCRALLWEIIPEHKPCIIIQPLLPTVVTAFMSILLVLVLYTANSGVRYNAPYSFLSLITNSVGDKYRNEKGAVLFPRAYLKERLNGRDKWLNAGVDMRLALNYVRSF